MSLPPPVSPPASPPSRVLCAEDDPLYAKSLVQLLCLSGLAAEWAENGSVALARIAGADRFDVLITDHQMPGADGLELVRGARANGFAGRVIVLSTGLTDHDKARYRPHGVAAFLEKRSSLEGILRAIASC